MLELQHNSLNFSFPEVHEFAKCRINFQRTLRIPDDGKSYPLPPGLSTFSLRHVDDFKDRVPARWVERGGVMLPMYQSEAMWILFAGNHAGDRTGDHGTEYPFAVKVATGKVSAVTGEGWHPGLHEGDYVVLPKQRWLDGYCVEKGKIRQFVAAPLGAGFTTEEQITGKAEFGGLQIEVFPMKKDAFLRRFPRRERTHHHDRRRLMRSAMSTQSFNADMARDFECVPCAAGLSPDMGLAPGGMMVQEIHADPFDYNDWDLEHRGRVFIHLANSLVWKAITQQDPPHPPPTAAEYKTYGLPWFDYYNDGVKALHGSAKLANVKSVLQMGFQKGVQILPENQSVEIKSDEVHHLGSTKRPDEVRNGNW